MTQHDLARATGMPQPSIARIEAGTVVPRTETLIEILSATGHQLSVEPVDPAVDREAIRRQLAMDVPQRTVKTGRVLRRLRRFAVPFVLTGDLAEVAHGSPLKVGRVIEVCVASTDIAQDRLKRALDDLAPTTDAARLQVLSETAAGDTYDVLARNAVPLHVEAGILIPVAALEDLIRSRRAGRTQREREAAWVLEAIIEETRPGRRGAAPKGPSAPGVRDR
jgi:transcriptional regulator with XRE-family HTH domain